MDYEIRRACVDDAEQLGYLHSFTWRTAYQGIVPDEILYRMTPEKRIKYFKVALKNNTEDTYVLTTGDKIIGMITLGPCRDSDLDDSWGEIWGIYLHPSYWRKGYGTILMSWGMGELRRRGYQKVSLWVLQENNQARNFYEKMGFIQDGALEQIEIGRPLYKVRFINDLQS